MVSRVLFVSTITQKWEKILKKYFTSAGYSNQEYALSLFDEHQDASCHRLAMTYEVIVPQHGCVKEMQSEWN